MCDACPVSPISRGAAHRSPSGLTVPTVRRKETTMDKLARLFALPVAATLALGACTTAPVTGRKELNLVGDGTMNQLGGQTYKQEMAKAKPDTNPEHRAVVERVSKRLVDAAEKNYHPGYDWTISLIDDPKTVNPWSLPG